MSERPTRPPRIGDPAPDFELDSVDGRRVALRDFRGKRALLWLSRGIF